MTLKIEFPADVEERIKREAARLGIDETEYARRLIEANLPSLPQVSDQRTLDLLAKWDLEDETNDPAEIKRRQQDWEQFSRAMNEDSLSGRLVYP